MISFITVSMTLTSYHKYAQVGGKVFNEYAKYIFSYTVSVIICTMTCV